MNIKIIYRDSLTNPRLTIAKDEIRIKLPIHFSEVEDYNVLKFFDKIIKELPYDTQTLRGELVKNKIKMRTNGGITIKTFIYESIL